MISFSIDNLKSLDGISRSGFHKSLSTQLGLIDGMLQDCDLIDYRAVRSYIAKEGELPEALSTVDDLYSNVTAGIQAGSGDQEVLMAILNAINVSWNNTQALIWRF